MCYCSRYLFFSVTPLTIWMADVFCLQLTLCTRVTTAVSGMRLPHKIQTGMYIKSIPIPLKGVPHVEVPPHIIQMPCIFNRHQALVVSIKSTSLQSKMSCQQCFNHVMMLSTINAIQDKILVVESPP